MAVPGPKSRDEGVLKDGVVTRLIEDGGCPTNLSALPHVPELVVSRLVASSRARSTFTLPQHLCKALTLYGRTGLVRDTHVEPAPYPDLPTKGWPQGETSRRRSGRTPIELHREYENLTFEEGWQATLPPSLLEHFVPQRLWPVVLTVIADGPEVAVERAERALRTFARSSVRPMKHLPPGPPARSSVAAIRDTFHRLFKELVQLRGRGLRAEGIEGWTGFARLPMPETGSRQQDRRAPRPEILRETLARLDQEVAAALGIEPGADELDAVRTMKDTAIATCRAFTPLRDRVAFVLAVMLGARVGALAALRRSDFVEARTGPPPEHRQGAAILVRPGKGWGPEVVRPKPIPPGVADVIRVYLLYLERVVPIQHRWHARETGRNWPFETCPADHPLIVSNRVHFRALEVDGIRTLLRGVRPTPGGSSGRRPVLVREPDPRDPVPPGTEEFYGYRPHEYRRATRKLAERAGEIWNTRNPAVSGNLAVDPALFGSAILDHRPKGDAIANLYGERDAELGYEILSERVLPIMWELLRGQAGARRRPNVPAIKAWIADLRAVEGELVFCQRRADEEWAAGNDPLPVRIERPAPSPEAPEREQLRFLVDAVRQLLERQDLHIAREERHLSRLAVLHRLHDETFRLGQQRAEILREVNALWYETERWEVVPDSAPAGVENIRTTLQALLDDRSSTDEGAYQRAIRDWVTLREFAWACDVSKATVLRWVRGEHLPATPTRRPWAPDSIPLDDSQGERWRRIWLPGVNPDFWTTGSQERVQALVSRWPQERGWSSDGGKASARCQVPLIVSSNGLALPPST
jgi:hypothetical protein